MIWLKEMVLNSYKPVKWFHIIRIRQIISININKKTIILRTTKIISMKNNQLIHKMRKNKNKKKKK